jgi:8-oxo-dGTP pyrophosphatase MutT (NUDIX family)
MRDAADSTVRRQLPAWWYPLADNAAAVRSDQIARWAAPREGGRESAVLILLGEGADRPAVGSDGALSGTPAGDRHPGAGSDRGGPDVLLLERAHTLRNHAGQPAFPGGVTDPGDTGPVDTALREAQEEVGLDPATVDVVSVMPALWLPPSNFVVTPVLAWWHTPHPVAVGNPAEVARVERVPVAELADPANRLRVRHPSGHIGAAFTVRGLLVWGFTAGLLAALLDLAGWARPWDHARVTNLPVSHTPGG